jgi:putative oxidoreductase
MALGMTVLRAVMGLFFMGHGLQKLGGWFGGHGLEATGQAFESMGMKPGKRHATAAGAAETAGGAMLLTGFMTPVGATLVTGVMTTAIDKVHGAKGPWVTEGGYEYNATLIAGAFAIATTGPGPLSLDRALGSERSGALVGLASLGAGIGGALLADRFLNAAGREPEAPAAATPQTAPSPAEAPATTTGIGVA